MIPRLLIVGLGNPGTSYVRTRHNLGAVWVQKLCANYNVSWQVNTKLISNLAKIDPNILCMISEDYMNHSGFAVKKVAEYYKFDKENILVVHDDLDLSPGEVKLKLHGGHGGHNGLRHIIEQLQTNNFKRLRIGIGHPKIKEQVTDYVLSTPNADEKSIINRSIEDSLEFTAKLLTTSPIDWQQMMQLLHQPKI